MELSFELPVLPLELFYSQSYKIQQRVINNKMNNSGSAVLFKGLRKPWNPELFFTFAAFKNKNNGFQVTFAHTHILYCAVT